jgi:hypothetical protein
MRLCFIVLFWLLTSLVMTFAQSKDAERTVEKVEETKRGRKTITETFKNGMLVRKHVEEKRTGDKPVEAKYTHYYQGGQEVLFECWESKSKETSRYFMVEKRLVMAELDRDGDGLFEWVVLFGKDEKVSTVFRRTTDGKIELLDGDAFDKFKHASDTAKELFER